MPPKRSLLITLFGTVELIVGVLGSAFVLVVFGWIAIGRATNPNFGDSNVAGAILMYAAFEALPALPLLVVSVGLLLRKPWARISNIALFAILALWYWVLPLLFLGRPISWASIYAVLTVVSLCLLARPGVAEEFARPSVDRAISPLD